MFVKIQDYNKNGMSIVINLLKIDYIEDQITKDVKGKRGKFHKIEAGDYYYYISHSTYLEIIDLMGGNYNDLTI